MFCKKIFNKYLDAYKYECGYFHYCVRMKVYKVFLCPNYKTN